MRATGPGPGSWRRRSAPTTSRSRCSGCWSGCGSLRRAPSTPPGTSRAHAGPAASTRRAAGSRTWTGGVGGAARRFLAVRGHLLRDDERDLLGEWLAEPVDMYEVSSVRRGSELSLRSLVGGPQRIGQRDRMFSLSVRRLDIVIGRLLPDGARPDGGGRHLQALGGMGVLPRDLRESRPGTVPRRSCWAGKHAPVPGTAAVAVRRAVITACVPDGGRG